MLPYETIEEAEATLGRGLSVAEKVWFKYSANKSDFLLHFHNILFLCFFYSLASLPYVFIELNRPNKFKKYKIQPKVENTFRDMIKCYKYVIHTFVLTVGPLQIISYPSIKGYQYKTKVLKKTSMDDTKSHQNDKVD
ncbi:methylsterol monooxygenase 1-1-like [Senna tora]|uniref:Methylsterol monooxygenase 1-1-like n=1 Tax=Senna tora TaxID=362788 RepID=A0A834XIX4_9FABA|nr:methylsterol monooxygenase 1-1-like [Senna tora]